MNTKLIATGVAGVLLGASAMLGATTLTPDKEAKPITWDTSLQSGESISKAYTDIANSMGVTASDSGKFGGNIQLIIREKVKGEMCK